MTRENSPVPDEPPVEITLQAIAILEAFQREDQDSYHALVDGLDDIETRRWVIAGLCDVACAELDTTSGGRTLEALAKFRHLLLHHPGEIEDPPPDPEEPGVP
jgi:hypothetical protein